MGGTMEQQQNVDVAAGTNNTVDQVGSLLQTGANAAMPGLGSAIGAISSLGSGLVDAIDKPDEYGMNSFLGSVLKGNLKGGPIGMAIAGFNYSKDLNKVKQLKLEKQQREKRYEEDRLASRTAADPTLTTGSLSASYFAKGGQMMGNYSVDNGSTTPLSSSATKFNGPKHHNGGIKISSIGAEVEGGETVDGGYVFSDQLINPMNGKTFAKTHEKLAKTIGRIEQKSLSPERVNSLDFLREREQDLKLSQEYLKQMGLK